MLVGAVEARHQSPPVRWSKFYKSEMSFIGIKSTLFLTSLGNRDMKSLLRLTLVSIGFMSCSRRVKSDNTTTIETVKSCKKKDTSLFNQTYVVLCVIIIFVSLKKSWG